MLKKLFSEVGVKNVVTLFHKPSSPSSSRILDVLKQASGESSAATGSQTASKDTKDGSIILDVTQQPPTNDQLRSILEYVGDGNASKVVDGANDGADAQRRVRLDASVFKRPLVVDWNAGKVVIGDNESELRDLIKSEKS